MRMLAMILCSAALALSMSTTTIAGPISAQSHLQYDP